MDLLVSSRDAIQQEEKESGKYPTRYLRVELCLAILENAGKDPEAQRLRNEWTGAYGAMTRMIDYKTDVKKVAKTLVVGPYHGHRLDEVISPPAKDPSVAAQSALAGLSLEGTYSDARSIFAAARWLHENHAATKPVQLAYGRLRDHLVRATAHVFRAQPDKPKQAAEEAALVKLEEADQAAGLALRTQLGL
jgi:hypothetical protein